MDIFPLGNQNILFCWNRVFEPQKCNQNDKISSCSNLLTHKCVIRSCIGTVQKMLHKNLQIVWRGIFGLTIVY